MTYAVQKHTMNKDWSWTVIDFGGGYTEKEMKAITRGYRRTAGDIYERKGSNTFYVVKES